MNNVEANATKYNKKLKIFALASFLNDMGSDMIYPIWPLFLTNVLGANMAVLGLVDGLGNAIVSISQAISGYISDRTKKRKVFIWLGYLFAFISRLGYAFAASWQCIVPFRVLDRAGKIRGAPRDAIIADESDNTNRGKNFGLLRAMDNLGAVVGIVICILFFNYLGYRNLFLIAAIPSIIAATLILIFIKEKKYESLIYKGLALKDLSKDFKLVLLLSGIFALGSFSYSFLLVYAKSLGFAAGFIPILYLMYTAVAAVLSLPFGKLADRFGRKMIIIVAYIFWILTCLSFLVFKNHVGVYLAFIFYGLHLGALDPVQTAFVSELAPVNHRASSLGAFKMIIGLSALPASLMAGVLWDSFGTSMPFYLSIALTFVSLILLMFLSDNKVLLK